MTTQEAEAAVARGVAVLDAWQPDWFRHIDVGVLDIGSCDDCILGQLYRDLDSMTQTGFVAGLHDLGWYDKAHQFGVGGIDGNETARLLTDAWMVAIAQRLHPDAPRVAPQCVLREHA